MKKNELFFFHCSVLHYVNSKQYVRKQYLCFGAVEHSPFSQIMQTSIPLPTNAKEKITGLYEQRLPPPPFASVYRNLPFFTMAEKGNGPTKKSYVIGYNQQRRVYIQ